VSTPAQDVAERLFAHALEVVTSAAAGADAALLDALRSR
jgi:hypothetical protein